MIIPGPLVIHSVKQLSIYSAQQWSLRKRPFTHPSPMIICTSALIHNATDLVGADEHIIFGDGMG